MEDIRARILALAKGNLPDHAGWVALIQDASEEDRLFSRNFARERAQARFGKQVFFRGIIEFTNHCKNDCYYCGIRRSNRELSRYRLTEEEILTCCKEGYRLGYRTFVLQGGSVIRCRLRPSTSTTSIRNVPALTLSARRRVR